MPRETIQTKYGHMGDQRLTLTSAVYYGEVLDTKVEMGDQYICSIAGAERQQFLDELSDLVDKYRI